MKPSQLKASSVRIKFDFEVPDYRPRGKRRLGPKLLPITLLLPDDLTDCIKHKYEDGGKIYYIIGDRLQPADRRAVPARKILDYVSRRTFEEYEERLRSQEEHDTVESSTESTPPQIKSGVKNPTARGTAVFKRGMEMGDIRDMVVQDARAPTPQQDASGMFVGNDAVGSFTNVPVAVSTTYPKSPETVKPNTLKRKRCHPFLDSDDEDDSKPMLRKSTENDLRIADLNEGEDEVGLFLFAEDLMNDDEPIKDTTSRSSYEGKSSLFVSSSTKGFRSSSRTSVESTLDDPERKVTTRMASRDASSESKSSPTTGKAPPPKKKQTKRKSLSYSRKSRRRASKKPAYISEEDEEEEEDEEGKDWDVNGILEDEIRSGSNGEITRYFKIDWAGDWPPSWEPEENVTKDVIDAYYEKKKLVKPSVIQLEDSDNEPLAKRHPTPKSAKSAIIILPDSDEEPISIGLSTRQSAKSKSPITQLEDPEDENAPESQPEEELMPDALPVVKTFKQLKKEHYKFHIRKKSGSPQVQKSGRSSEPMAISDNEDDNDDDIEVPKPESDTQRPPADAATTDKNAPQSDMSTTKQGTTDVFAPAGSAVLKDIASEKARLNTQQSPGEANIETVSASASSEFQNLPNQSEDHPRPSSSFQKRSVDEIKAQAWELYSGSMNPFHSTKASPGISSPGRVSSTKNLPIDDSPTKMSSTR